MFCFRLAHGKQTAKTHLDPAEGLKSLLKFFLSLKHAE